MRVHDWVWWAGEVTRRFEFTSGRPYKKDNQVKGPGFTGWVWWVGEVIRDDLSLHQAGHTKRTTR